VEGGGEEEVSFTREEEGEDEDEGEKEEKEEKEEEGKDEEGPEGKRGVISETVRFHSSWPVTASTARRDCSTFPNHSNCLAPPPPLPLLVPLPLVEGEGAGEGVSAGVTVGVPGECVRGSIM